MEDIGMHPDFRSGYGEERCAVCNRRIESHNSDVCVECDREVCLDCLEETDDGPVCIECWEGWDE